MDLKSPKFNFLPFLEAQKLSHKQTLKYMSHVQFSSFFLGGEMLVKMSSIRISNNWNYQNLLITAVQFRLIPLLLHLPFLSTAVKIVIFIAVYDSVKVIFHLIKKIFYYSHQRKTLQTKNMYHEVSHCLFLDFFRKT